MTSSTLVRTRRDYAMISLVAVPIVALILVLGMSTVSWKANAAKIEPRLEQSFSAERMSAESPLAEYYNDRASKDRSMKHAQLNAAAEVLTGHYNELTSILDDRDLVLSPEEETRMTEYVQRFADEAQPLIEAFDELEFSGPTWEAIELSQEFDSGVYVRYPTAVDTLLRMDFESAVRSKEGDKAIAALARHRKLYSAFAVPAAGGLRSWGLMWEQRMCRQVSAAIHAGLWNSEQLQRVDELLSPVVDLAARWKVAIDSAELKHVNWLRTGRINMGFESVEDQFFFAPSSRLKWLREVDSLRNVSLNNPMKVSDRMIEQSKNEAVTRARLDVLLQFPFVCDFEDLTSNQRTTFYRFADAYAIHETERRLVRTAAAMLRFREEFGEYPQDVSKLSKLNFPPEESRAMFGTSFQLRDLEDEKVLSLDGAATGNRKNRFLYNGQYWDLLQVKLP